VRNPRSLLKTPKRVCLKFMMGGPKGPPWLFWNASDRALNMQNRSSTTSKSNAQYLTRRIEPRPDKLTSKREKI